MSTAMPSACQAGQARRGQVWQPFLLARLSVTVLNTKLRPEMSSCHFSLLCVAFLINIINVCARPSSLCCVPVNVCVCVCVCVKDIRWLAALVTSADVCAQRLTQLILCPFAACCKIPFTFSGRGRTSKEMC